MSTMKRTTYFLTQILLHRAVVHAWKRKLRIQYLLRKAIAEDDDNRNMKSEVHKGRRHHERHSKHKRRQENSSKICVDDASPVPSVPSDMSGSETCFPLAKDHGESASESLENGVARKRRQRDDDNTRCEVLTVSDSDADNDVEEEEERAKRRKKHKHKGKKKRKHHSRKDKVEGDPPPSTLIEPKRRPAWETDSDHSPSRQNEEHLLVRVKQEPLSSDEDTRRRQRTREEKKQSQVRDGNDHSNSGRDSSRPERRIKEEPRDRSSSRERKPRSELLRRHGRPERRNGDSDDYHGHRDRRNGRVNDETSTVIKTERDDDPQSRDRRHRNNQREDRSRDHRGDSREGPRRIKRERPTEDEKEYEWGKSENRQSTGGNAGAAAPAEDKKKPNFGLSGKLTEDVNVYNGVVIKYSEPPEARKPKRRWRFYPFKGDETLPTLYLHRQSAFLIGRDRKVADIPVDHPSCSKQHAALQYRLVPFTREDGSKGKRVRPYIIDLDSANGTYVNNKRIEPRKYVELMERDVIKFGYSSRDYVLLHEHSKGDEEDDDQNG